MTRNYLFLILPFLLIFHNSQAQNSFAGVFQESNAAQVYWNNASWDSFINKHKELREKGYQMIDFEGVHVGKGKSGRFWGIWSKTNKQSRLQSRTSWEDFLKLVSDRRKEGYSLQDIESMLNRNGKRIYLGLFVKTGERAQFVQKYRSRSELFSSTENFKKKRKAYIIDFDPIRTKDGKYQFLAVYTQGSDKKTRFSSHDKISSFNSNRKNMKKEGLRMKDFESYKEGNKTYFMAIFGTPSSNKKPDESFWRSLNWNSLKAHRNTLKQSRNLNLVDIEVFSPKGKIVAPEFYDSKSKQTPDIWQHMPKIEKYSRSKMSRMSAKKDGKEFNSDSFCGPTSVSNGIMYWVKNGYPKLNPKKSQVEMVKVLGSEEYMNAFNGGTNLYKMSKALHTYLKENGSQLKKAYIQHIGKPSRADDIEDRLSYVDLKKFQKSIRLDYFKKGLINPKSMHILLWGKYKKEGKELIRTGGHFVTLVGYGIDDKGKLDKNLLIIHNPSSSDKKPKREFLNLRPLAGFDWIKSSTRLKSKNDEGETKWSATAEDKILLKKGKSSYVVLEAIIDYQIK
ncbi:MAG: hypothetical protein AAFR87_08625 [Bacteroidota bacterium]